jgi:Ca2+-binding EF-hand superfamily protein
MFDQIDTDGDGKISREEFEVGIKSMQREAKKIEGLLAEWASPDGPRKTAESCFRTVDANGDGHLEWNNSEIRAFVLEVFARLHVAIPPWQDSVWYDLYRSADLNQNLALEPEEAFYFAKHCLEKTLATLLKSPAVAKACGNKSLVAEHRLTNYGPPPLSRTVVSYRNGVSINLVEVSTTLQRLVAANAQYQVQMTPRIHAGEHIKMCAQIFYDCDVDINGCLTWNNGEIKEFVRRIFNHYGLQAPEETDAYTMYRMFDRDNSGSLDALECTDMMDALLRSLFAVFREQVLAPSSHKDLRSETISKIQSSDSHGYLASSTSSLPHGTSSQSHLLISRTSAAAAVAAVASTPCALAPLSLSSLTPPLSSRSTGPAIPVRTTPRTSLPTTGVPLATC